MAGRQVLVVEGEDAARQSLVDLLEGMECEVWAARDLENALHFLAGDPPAVALIDLASPRADGQRMLGAVRAVFPDTEILAMARRGAEQTTLETLLKGSFEYLHKPFADFEEVRSAVERAAHRRMLSLRNRQLAKDLERKNRELQTAVKRLTSLIDAGRAMSGIQSLPELLDFLMGVVVRELDVERASLMLADETTGDMAIVASRGISEEIVRTVRVKIGEGIAGWVARTGKPIVVKDAKNDPRTKEWALPNLSGSFISAPVVLSIPVRFLEKVLGVINVTKKRSGESFDHEDMEYLFGLAGQAAVAIERARYHEELLLAYESLKSAQNQLVMSERLKALGQMAAGVAHDFNNVLTGILGRAQFLQFQLSSKGADPQAVQSELAVIEKIAMQGAGTVRRVQDFTRIRRDQPVEEVDLNEIVRDAVEMTRAKWKDECEAKGVRVEVVQEAGDLPRTAGNAGELAQVLGNLIFNAVEAMPSGGKITFRTRRDGEWIVLEAADTGTGMKKEVRDRLFEPFFTTKETGTGLGMSIVYGIVTRYGGKVDVDSEEGKGTTFRICLPVQPVETGRKPARRAGTGERTAAASLLVVEDDKLNRDLFRNSLSACGHIVTVAATGAEALSIFRQDAFDLVITDLSMPGISGWEVTKEVKKIDPKVPVILLSGWAIQQDEASVRAAGVDYVLAKPCTLEQLRETVEEALAGGVET